MIHQGIADHIVELEDGDTVTVENEHGETLTGEITEAPPGSDPLGRIVRRFMDDGRKVGLYVEIQDDGGFGRVDMMRAGVKSNVVGLEGEADG